jgi:hypothetical protein
MKLKLLKTEASWIQTRIGCYVSLDNQLLDVITPLNSPHEVPTLDIPPEGTLRLIFKDMGRPEGYLGSLSMPLSHFLKTSNVWLPLYSNPNNDLLVTIPTDVVPPRILVNVCVNDSFNMCDDELFQSFSEFHLENDSEIVVASQILPPSLSEPELCKTSTFKLQKSPGYIEKLLLQLKKYKILSEENHYLAMSYKEKCLELESKLVLSDNKIKELIYYYTDLSDKNQTRELDLIDRINSQEKEIIDLQGSVYQLNASVRSLQHENFFDKEKFKLYSRFEDEFDMVV